MKKVDVNGYVPVRVFDILYLICKVAALEHLRKLIEVSTEKIKSARVKEEQARKVGW